MSTPPTFRKQASVWSISDSCFVVPQYGETNADLIAPLIAQARAMLVTSNPPPSITQLQIGSTEKWISGGPGAATTNTNCPTGDVPPPNDPTDAIVVKCQTQPPYNDSLPTTMTVVYSGDISTTPLQDVTGSDYMSTIGSAQAGTGFWVLHTSNSVYLVTFPPPSLPLPQQPPPL